MLPPDGIFIQLWKKRIRKLKQRGDDGGGNENIATKMNLRLFKLYRVYLNPLNLSNVGDFFLELNSQAFYPGSKRDRKI